jgi:hypothetical protein
MSLISLSLPSSESLFNDVAAFLPGRFVATALCWLYRAVCFGLITEIVRNNCSYNLALTVHYSTH